MELILLILVSVLFAAIVFSILDRNSTRVVAVIGSLLTFLITFALPFGLIIGAIVTLGVFLWAYSKTKNSDNSTVG